MPEGPEIRLAADRVASVLEGQTLARVFFAFDRLKRWEEQLEGQQVSAVETRGKAMLIRIGDTAVYSHNQLYGRWYVSREGKRPRIGRQLRLGLETGRGAAWLYSASSIEVLSATEEQAYPPLSRLGPDSLHDTVTTADIRAQLRAPKNAGRRLAGLYLDQGFLAGIGNYLRSEILWHARCHPGLRPADLPPRRLAALARATLLLPRRSYVTRGVTRDASTAARLRAAGHARARWRFYVFGQDGEPCPRCGEAVEREDWSGRRLYLCRRCQEAPA